MDDPFIADSARRHGVADDDMLHAYRHPTAVKRGRNDMVMLIGADRAGRPLEIGVVDSDDGDVIVHAMPARPKFLR